MATEESVPKQKALSSSISVDQKITQNFLLVWLNTDMHVSDDDFRTNITHLRRIVNSVNTFTDPQKAVNFLTRIKEDKAFIIISGDLGRQIVSEIHPIAQVHSIYLLGTDKADHEQWIKDWSKVKGIFTEINPICVLLQEAADEFDPDCISISIVSTEEFSKKLDELDQSFMYTQILKEILFEIDSTAQTVPDFIAFCRNEHSGNADELGKITLFEKDYCPEKAVYWYTYECFLYRTLNRALRNQEMDMIIKLGFFIRDLHRQLKVLHLQQYGDKPVQEFTLYRGQSMTIRDFEKLLKTPGGLLSFNNFLSTSIDPKVSLEFGKGGKTKPGSVSLLFEIVVSTEILTSPYALLNEVSFYKDKEQEILFSAHTVFRLGEIIPMDENKSRYRVHLTLMSNDNPQLMALTKRLREETEGSTGWHRLGVLLAKIAEYKKAEGVYKELLAQHDSSDDAKKAHIYHQLGWVTRKQGNYKEALSYNQKALKIRQNIRTAIDIDLASSYHNLGDVCTELAENSDALSYYEKAIEMRQKILPPDHPDLATSNNCIGDVYSQMGEYEKALSFYKTALKMRQIFLPSNHPDLATSYNNIGTAYCDMGEYSQALPGYEKALEISQKTLPPNHPDLAAFYNNFGFVYREMGEYSKAHSYFEKAYNIWSKALDPNHPTLFKAHNNIGSVYTLTGQHAQALSYYEKALEVCKNSRSENHHDLATSYSSLGQAYYKMGEYAKALSYYEKDLEISEKVLSPNHIELAASYNNLGLVYYHLGEYSKALWYYEKVFDIFERALPPNHPDLASPYKNIGNVHKSTGDYVKALFYYEKGLEICLTSLPDNHPNLATAYNNIGLANYHMGEYSKALSYFEKALKIREEALPENHADFAISYDSFGDAYNSMNDYTKALSYYENALDIRHTALPPNHPDLAVSYNNIGNAYKTMGNYEIAFWFYEQALNCAQQRLPELHPNLQTYKKNIEDVRS
jgi:tetratricopeptide (TPR) repeat protein